MEQQKASPFISLQVPEFRNFLAGKFLVTLSFVMQSTVVFWQIDHITHDAFFVGLIGFAELVPNVAISLFSGLVVDSFPRKKIIFISLTGLTFSSFLLLLFSSPGFEWITEKYWVYPIYSVIFFSGICRGFLSPSIAAFQTQLVSKEIFPNAATWSGVAWQGSAVLGPMLGGLLVGFNGVQTAYLADFGIMAFSLLLFFAVPSKAVPEKQGEKESIWKSLGSGWKFVFGHQLILGAITLDLFAVLFGGAVALIPTFSREVLGMGPEYYGILRSAPALGAVTCALFIAVKPPKTNSGIILLSSVFGFGVCMIVFALSTSFYLSFAALVISGSFDMVSVVIRHTIVQMYTPEHMRGRVSAVNNIFIGSSNELGAFESGAAARAFGLVPSVVIGGSLTLITVALVTAIAPRLRKMDLKDITV
ncbi:MFS transporter [Leptospira wolffii]|uniref:Multidrug efflux pump Tap n=1 Tax=Leptospira wolffii TaxID=409998 RepID=A0A2M9ZB38_9LEPT|nr:MFS transporter [Leptospira wolffii]PJZ65567.1 MFS transporter [Leptospira wolffii]TGK56221.1 MFS transporter [Leptospira wolffii]TGK72268.1 MFS transporter [Leptospira wolffii]TGK72826.1 MFS transporter [Leptospira wolffii]TGL27845.1 MFS transporter [Leptospira wolffii]